MKSSESIRPGETTRQSWMDVARGIAIILVVFGHVERGLTSAGMVPTDSWIYPLDYLIYTFHMPLFFLLAGMNVEHSLRRGPGNFFRGKCWTVAYPYFLWSLIQGSAQVAMGGAVNHATTWRDLIAIPWLPLSPFWFLYALFICHVLILLMPRDRRWLALLAVIFYAVSFTGILGIVSTGLHFFLFYALGVLLAPHLEAWFSKGLAREVGHAATGVLFVMAAAGCYFSGVDYTSPLALPATLLGIAGLIGLSRRCGERLTRILGLVGMMSMSIFVMHILAASGTRVILMKLHVPSILPLYLLAGTVVGVALPIAAHLILQRLGWLSALGLPRLQKPVSV